MKYFVLIILCVFAFSCKKDAAPTPSISGTWKWYLQRAASGNPLLDITPQNSGINETLSFTNNTYSLVQNGIEKNNGTYVLLPKPTTQMILSFPQISYSNARVSDSTVFYFLNDTSDSLAIISLSGAGRYYSK